jgi:hypothetical protein
MEKRSVEAIVAALNQHQVQYLIVGGLAVVAHGYLRFTADMDLLLAVDRENLTRAVAALKELDFRPRAPVVFEQFIDPAMRQQWAAQKNMKVFSLSSPKHPKTEIDLFLEPPIDFAAAYANAVRQEVAPNLMATFCSLSDLLALKQIAGRAVDLRDIVELRRLHRMDER